MRATCIGYVRGWCGKIHYSQNAAEDCIGRDIRDASATSVGGGCDRRVVTAVNFTRDERNTTGDYFMAHLITSAKLENASVDLLRANAAALRAKIAHMEAEQECIAASNGVFPARLFDERPEPGGEK